MTRLVVAAKKNRRFCDGYKELALLCNGIDRHEIQAKNVNRCLLLSLNRTVLKIFPQEVILPQNRYILLYLVYRPVCKMVLTEFLSGIKFVGP